MNEKQDCLTCSFRSPMFDLLTTEELLLMRENRIPVTFRKGETIRKQGAAMTHVISVTHGLAKLFRERENEDSAILRIVRPTNFIGGPGIFYEPVHHFTVSALTETCVCFIDLQVFKNILDNNKRFQEAFLRDFSMVALASYYRLIELSRKQAPGRMADALLYLFEDVYGKHKFRLHLSKHDMADLAAISRESSAKLLREFQNMGILELTKDEFILLDPEALKRISRTG